VASQSPGRKAARGRRQEGAASPGPNAGLPSASVDASSTFVEAEELVRALAELGLSPNEGRLYISLLRLETPTAAELARSSGVPRPKVYEALGALETRGFCALVGGRVTRYRALPADVALRGWIRHRDHERAAAAEREQALGDMLVRLLPRPQQARPAIGPPEYMEAISGRTRTTAAIEEIIGRAEESVRMMQQPPWLQPRSRWNVAEVAAAKRGAHVRVIYSREAARDPRRWSDLLAAGGECRVLEEVPMKLLVRDDAEALISLRDANTGEQSTLSAAIRHPDLARPLGLLFEQHWDNAKPLRKGSA
jgi:sugar-specific transcriptional regulator TrmB